MGARGLLPAVDARPLEGAGLRRAPDVQVHAPGEQELARRRPLRARQREALSGGRAIRGHVQRHDPQSAPRQSREPAPEGLQLPGRGRGHHGRPLGLRARRGDALWVPGAARARGVGEGGDGGAAGLPVDGRRPSRLQAGLSRGGLSQALRPHRVGLFGRARRGGVGRPAGGGEGGREGGRGFQGARRAQGREGAEGEGAQGCRRETGCEEGVGRLCGLRRRRRHGVLAPGACGRQDRRGLATPGLGQALLREDRLRRGLRGRARGGVGPAEALRQGGHAGPHGAGGREPQGQEARRLPEPRHGAVRHGGRRLPEVRRAARGVGAGRRRAV
mmetsp:Transcript_8577/g.25805  ORF Transcript_8577/g.25805 Transcript_8577/m.25805 type:complete len:331 (-) Transcript_8577:193-1185(-)